MLDAPEYILQLPYRLDGILILKLIIKELTLNPPTKLFCSWNNQTGPITKKKL